MKAIIIDDERHCIDSLSIMLGRYTDIDVVHIFESSLQAAKELGSIEADILFLDIEMPYINGFELLTIFPEVPMKVVFITAYNEYAVKAFKFNAIDYLMKPIVKEELLETMEKIENLVAVESTQATVPLSTELLVQQFAPMIRKLAIPTLAGLEMILIEDISYLESKSNYCTLHMIDGKKHMVSKTLKLFEKKLVPYLFIRVHNSYVINPNHITRYVKGDGGYLIMDDGANISVSRSRKDELLKIINEL